MQIFNRKLSFKFRDDIILHRIDERIRGQLEDMAALR